MFHNLTHKEYEQDEDRICGLKDIADNQLCETKYPIKNQRALSLAISKLSLLEQIEKGGVEKKEIVQDFEVGSSGWSEQDCREFGQLEGFNSAVDLCNAHLVKKLEKLPEILGTIGITIEGNIIIDTKRISQAIITHLTGKAL